MALLPCRKSINASHIQSFFSNKTYKNQNLYLRNTSSKGHAIPQAISRGVINRLALICTNVNVYKLKRPQVVHDIRKNQGSAYRGQIRVLHT
jgi:hypothetical protein